MATQLEERQLVARPAFKSIIMTILLAVNGLHTC